MKSTEFLQGNKNAQLCMSDPKFGFNPYIIGTVEFNEWEAGFEHAFYVGVL